MIELPRLYPILDADALARSGVPLAMAAYALRDAGVRWLQYRDKRASDADVVERMRAEDAIRIVSREGLEAMLAELLRNSAEARAIGDRGRSVFVEQSGATARSVEALVALLEKRLVSRR